jgi:hypothetical protein
MRGIELLNERRVELLNGRGIELLNGRGIELSNERRMMKGLKQEVSLSVYLWIGLVF